MSLNRKLNSATVAVALSIMGGTGCDAIAEKFAGDAPVMPALGDVKRDPIQLSIGVDTTRSAIRHQLPNVIRVTAEVLSTEGILQEGDKINFCRIGGKGSGAICRQFEMEGGRDELLNALQSTEATGMTTWVRPAIATLFGTSPDGEHRIGIVWSDFKEEAKEPDRVRAPFPIHLLVPNDGYQEDAEEICGKVDGPCDVSVVDSGEKFARTLRSHTDVLTASARAEAEARAAAELAEQMAAYEQQKDVYAQKLRRIRNWTAGVLTTIVAALAAAVAGLTAYWNRPQLKGILVDARTRFGETISLNGRGPRIDLSQISLQKGVVSGQLKATRHGLVLNEGQPLQGGQEIAPGVYYFQNGEVPSPKEIRQLYDAYKGGKENT